VGRRRDAEIEALFRAHFVPLSRGLAFSAGSLDAASDAVQEAFLQLHRHWRKVSRYDDPIGWVRRVAVHRISNQRRSASRRDVAVDRLAIALDPDGASPDADPDHAGRLDLLAAVDALPSGQRLVVGLFYLAQMPVTDVADALEVSEGTVKSQLHDARAALRTALEVSDA
jgi:RNA polymerase sigma-70 factor (ECF subfamily)